MRETRVEHYPILIGKVKIGKITNAQWELSIEELHLHCIVVERKELITKMKSTLITNEYPNIKDKNAIKFFDPKLSTATD